MGWFGNNCIVQSCYQNLWVGYYIGILFNWFHLKGATLDQAILELLLGNMWREMCA